MNAHLDDNSDKLVSLELCVLIESSSEQVQAIAQLDDANGLDRGRERKVVVRLKLIVQARNLLPVA